MSDPLDSLDFDELQAAGIANPRERADLIEYLAGLGFSVDEMAEAERRGRLFGLAGDVLQWSGRPVYTLQTAAEELRLSADDVAHAWALLGTARLEEEWDNPQDAVYDDWKRLYGV